MATSSRKASHPRAASSAAAQLKPLKLRTHSIRDRNGRFKPRKDSKRVAPTSSSNNVPAGTPLVVNSPSILPVQRRWPNHPNEWPTGEIVTRSIKSSWWRRLLRLPHKERGVVEWYRGHTGKDGLYTAANVEVAIQWRYTTKVQYLPMASFPELQP